MSLREVIEAPICAHGQARYIVPKPNYLEPSIAPSVSSLHTPALDLKFDASTHHWESRAKAENLLRAMQQEQDHLQLHFVCKIKYSHLQINSLQ